MPARDLRDRLRSLGGGPLPAWPELVDALAERWFRSRPRLRVTAAVAAIVALLTVAGHVAARSPWGDDVTVLVAARSLPAGHTLAPGDLVPTARPERTVPAAVLDLGTAWVGAVATGPLPAGAVVTDAHLAVGGLSDLVSAGRVAVAVPATLLPLLEPGRRVDLVGGDDPAGGRNLARDARVLAADAEHVWIEVDREDAGAVAAAIAWGRVTVALLGR